MYRACFENIQEVISNEIKGAKKSIEIAVAWFTDPFLFSELKSARIRGITILLVIQDDEINRQAGIDYKELVTAGASVFWYKSNYGIMHHKFCVIDKRQVLFGTYNWTRSAANYNRENLMVMDDPALVSQFREELNNILQHPGLQAEAGSKAYSVHAEVAVSPFLNNLKIEIQLLQAEIIQLEEEKATIESLISEHDGKLKNELSELLLTHIQLNQELAELQAVITSKKIYKEESQRWKEQYVETENAIKEARNFKKNELNEDEKKDIRKLYREALLKIHPDRFANDPKKQKEAERLTDRLIKAFKSNDLKTVKEIWESIKKGYAFIDDLLKSGTIELLEEFLSKLKAQKNTLLSGIHELKESIIYKAIQNYPDFSVYISEVRDDLVTRIAILEKEIKKLKRK